MITTVHNIGKCVSGRSVILAMRRRLGLILLLAGLLCACSPSSAAHKRDVVWLRQDTLTWSPNSRWLAVTLPDEIYIHDDQRRYRGVESRAWVVSVLFAPGETPDAGVLLAATRPPLGPLVYESRLTAPRGAGGDLESPRVTVRLALSPDAELLAGGANDDQLDYVYLWDLSTRQIVREMEPRVQSVSSLSFSADGQFLAVGRWDEAEVLVWDVTAGELACTLVGHTDAAHTVVFSPEGDLLATGSDDGTVRLWGVTACQPLHTLERHSDWVSDVAFSPNGQVLASSGADGLVLLWDPTDGVERHRLEEKTRWVYDVEFSPDGELLAAGGSDGSTFMWKVKSGQLAQRMHDAHKKGIYEIAWSPNGQVLARGSMDGSVTLWDFTTNNWELRTPGFHEKTQD